MGLGRWAVYLGQERDRHRRRGPLGFLFVSISRVPAARVVGGACRGVSWWWIFRRCREGGERKREGEGREVARRERVWWSGLVHGTETDGGRQVGRVAVGRRLGGRRGTELGGQRATAGHCTGLLASQNRAARGRPGGWPVRPDPDPARLALLPAAPGPGGCPTLLASRAGCSPLGLVQGR